MEVVRGTLNRSKVGARGLSRAVNEAHEHGPRAVATG